VISRPRIQKPGLALAGFVRHVYGDRAQVLGLTEIDYLMSIPEDQARGPLVEYLKKGISVLILTRGLNPPPILAASAKDNDVPIFRTQLMTSTFISRLTRHLEDKLSPRASIHGVLVDVLGVGLLLIGRSGVG